MTEKQKRFVEEYLIDLNGAAAARRAGYSARSAANIAYRLLRRPEVSGNLQEENQRILANAQVRQEAVLEELKQVAFSHASDASGSEMKVASKLRALELLGKHLGIFEGVIRDAGKVEILEDV